MKQSRLVKNVQNPDCLKAGHLPGVRNPDKSSFQTLSIHLFSLNAGRRPRKKKIQAMMV